MKEHPLIPKRFILRIICNHCGIFAHTNMGMLPDREALLFHCTICNEEEVFYLNPLKEPKSHKKEKLKKELKEIEEKLIN